MCVFEMIIQPWHINNLWAVLSLVDPRYFPSVLLMMWCRMHVLINYELWKKYECLFLSEISKGCKPQRKIATPLFGNFAKNCMKWGKLRSGSKIFHIIIHSTIFCFNNLRKGFTNFAWSRFQSFVHWHYKMSNVPKIGRTRSEYITQMMYISSQLL